MIWKWDKNTGYRCFITKFKTAENVKFYFQLGQKPPALRPETSQDVTLRLERN